VEHALEPLRIATLSYLLAKVWVVMKRMKIRILDLYESVHCQKEKSGPWLQCPTIENAFGS